MKLQARKMNHFVLFLTQELVNFGTLELNLKENLK